MSFVGGSIGFNFRRATSVGGAPLLAPGAADFFSGSGGMTSRTMDVGGLIYSHERYTAGPEGFLISGGVLTSVVTSNPFQAFATVTRDPVGGSIYSRRRINTLAAAASSAAGYVATDHVTVGSGVANWVSPLFSSVTGDLGSLQINYVTSSALGSLIISQSNCQHRAGDWIGVKYRMNGPNLECRFIHNGQAMTAWAVVNTTTNPKTNKFGFRASAIQGVRDFLLVDYTNERMIDVIHQGRVAQLAANGSVQERVVIQCGVDVPAIGSLNYTYHNVSDHSVIMGHNQQPVLALSSGTDIPAFEPDATNALVLLPPLASPPSTGYYAIIRRTDISSGTALGGTPYLLPGRNIAISGQSISVQAYSTTTGLVPAFTPVQAFRVDASTDTTALSSGTAYRVRTKRSSSELAGSAFNQLCGGIQGANGALPMQVVMAGIGATTQKERNESTSYKNARNLGFAMVGFNIDTFILNAGTYEVADFSPSYASVAAARADFATQVAIEVAEIDAQLISPPQIMIVPLGLIFDTPDADSQEFRREQIKMVSDNPTRYYLGPWNMHCERGLQQDDRQPVSDKYHLNQLITGPGTVQSGYGRLFSMYAMSDNHKKGLTTTNRNGPRLTTAIRSGNTIVCTYDNLDGGTLAIENTAYLGDFRGGQDFGTDSSFGTPLLPIAAAATAVNQVTFTFASPPPVGACVRAAHGTHPFSRAATTKTQHTGGGTSGTSSAVYLNMIDRASMVCINYTGSHRCPVQPSINIGGYGVDHIVAT